MFPLDKRVWHNSREGRVGDIPIIRKAGLPSTALGAAFAPLLTVCSAVLARGTPATLSAMVRIVVLRRTSYNRQSHAAAVRSRISPASSAFVGPWHLLFPEQGCSVYMSFCERFNLVLLTLVTGLLFPRGCLY